MSELIQGEMHRHLVEHLYQRSPLLYLLMKPPPRWKRRMFRVLMFLHLPRLAGWLVRPRIFSPAPTPK
jgi:hypothetical protein